MVLVDSTVWIDLLRNQSSTPVARLRRLIEHGEATAAPVVVQEVLQGAANAAAFTKLRKYFLDLPLVGAARSVSLHMAAADLYARARWQAITPRSPHDCLVAVTAIDEDIPLLHDDRDFEQLARVDHRLKLLARE